MALINRSLTADEARAMLESWRAANPKLVAVWQAQPGCPDPDWCIGNSCCYWSCQADPDVG